MHRRLETCQTTYRDWAEMSTQTHTRTHASAIFNPALHVYQHASDGCEDMMLFSLCPVEAYPYPSS